MIFLYTLLLSVLTSLALIPLFTRLAVYGDVLDLPNERKVHSAPIPRSGGAAMAVGVILPLLLWNRSDRFSLAFAAGASLLVVFGLIDDFRGLSPKAKFAGQILAASVAMLVGGVKIMTLGMLLPDGVVLPDLIAVPLTLLAIVGVTNAINLADGLDGLAGGISLLIFCCIGFLAYLEGDHVIGLIALSLAGAIFGFLRFNTHPANVFMGDAGSQLLGFSAITLSLALTQGETALSPLLPLILVGFPVLDTLTVMFTRILQGRSPFSADKNHFHHHLMALGFRHSESVLVIYMIQTVLVAAAFLLRFHSDWMLLAGYIAFSALVLAAFTAAGRMGWRLRRLDPLDLLISRLIRARDEGAVFNVTFRIFETGIPLLLFLTCLLSTHIPSHVSAASLVLLAVILLTWLIDRNRLGNLLRITLYLLIPFAVYLSDHGMAEWLSDPAIELYNAMFWICTVLIVFISKFSGRNGGFRSTPLDFLVLFIVAIGLNLPDQSIQDYQIGVIAAKILVLYFCFEVLLAELRGKIDRIALATAGSLLVIAIK